MYSKIYSMKCVVIENGRYNADNLLFFYRHDREIPFATPFPTQPPATTCNNMLVMDVQEDGHVTVIMKTQDPIYMYAHCNRIVQRIEVESGKLIASRSDGVMTELWVKDCGRFYVRDGAVPSPIDCSPWDLKIGGVDGVPPDRTLSELRLSGGWYLA